MRNENEKIDWAQRTVFGKSRFIREVMVSDITKR